MGIGALPCCIISIGGLPRDGKRIRTRRVPLAVRPCDTGSPLRAPARSTMGTFRLPDGCRAISVVFRRIKLGIVENHRLPFDTFHKSARFLGVCTHRIREIQEK